MRAVLPTGNFHFVAALAKKFPHCVAKLYVPQNYNPIVLSGIVQRGGESVTMEYMWGSSSTSPTSRMMVRLQVF
jgi:hypothetical protein